MRGWWRDLTELVLPADCGGCGRPRAVLCPKCRGVLSGRAPCRVRPVPEPRGLPAVHAAAPYADEVRAVLLAHKERGALALATPLGVALAGAVRAGLRAARTRGQGLWAGAGAGLAGGDDGGEDQGEGVAGAAVRSDSGRQAGVVVRAAASGEVGRSGGADGVGRVLARSGHGGGQGRGEGGPGGVAEMAAGAAGRGLGSGVVLLVPVPSSRTAVAARGHDPARRIALAAAAELRRGGVPARVLAVLRQRRGVADQAGLNSRERLDNLAGALSVVPGGGRLLLEGAVVLVDDVMTTGASLAEAARAVRAAMAEEGPRRGVEERGVEAQGSEWGGGGRVGEAGSGRSGVGEGSGGGGVEGVGRGCAYGGAVTAEPIGCGSDAGAVYGAVRREGTGGTNGGSVEEGGGDRTGGPGMVDVRRGGGVGAVACAAVVAASPDAFEINRN
ncbi:ComF family protein [Streptomyces sp. Act143]|nr:ComF family protein [Streptomyces sp. Act143]PWI17880.1 ComF family protein [Streptomyces sp. Act143]